MPTGRSRALSSSQGPLAAWALASALGLLGCSGAGARELGNFEDEQGDEGAAPPDLPELECLPRSTELAGGCDDGQKCRYLVDPELGPISRCVPVVGDAAPGEPCMVAGETDTCRSGAQCWAIDPADEVGECRAYCDAFLTCQGQADDALVCIVADDGLLALCLDACVPTEPDACPPGFGCYDSPAGRWGCDRDQSGASGAHGTPCECANCCDPGLICVPAAMVDAPECMVEGAGGCCAAVCELPEIGSDPSEPVVCPTEAERCRAHDQDDVVQIGYERVGVCRL